MSRDRRFACEFPVEIRLPDGEAWALMVDIAVGGARLDGVSGVRVGQGCTLILDGRRMPATVTWTGSDGFGVKFQRRLLPQEFEMIAGFDAYAEINTSRQSRRLFGSRAA